MNVRLIPVFLVAAGLFAIGAGLAFRPASVVASVPMAHAAPVVDAIPVLPTIVVEAQAEPTLLPVVTVNASASDKAAAQMLDTSTADLAKVSAARLVANLAPRGSAGGSQRGGFAMPYYSFGKSLPRASKELIQ